MTANFRRFVALLPVVFASAPALATSASDFCAIYPIAVPQQVLVNKQVGDLVTGLPRGTGAGNFSWLTWNGANDAPTLAKSLLPPGNSDVYVNPGNAADHRLDLGDWTQGTPGSMNAKAVRDNLDALLRQDIIVPTWDNLRGQGSGLDYRVQRFVTIRLRDYRLTGQGWLSFEYRGEAICYNQPPTAAPQTLNTDEDIALPITLTGSDPDGDTLGFHIVSPPGHGRLSGDAPQVVYTPDADYHGSDSFSFRVNDGRIDSSPATVAIIVKPVNDAPVADPQTRATDEDTPLPITLTGRDSDGDALGFTVIEAPRHGELSGSGADLVYTPATNFNGEDSFRFKSNDGVLDSSPAVIAITVNPVNDAPTAAPQSLETEEQQPLPITLTGSDSDGDALSYRITTPPAHGSLAGSGADLVYTPGSGYHGDDVFEFVVNDGQLDSAPAVIAVTVKHVNRAPEIVSTPPASVEEGATYRYDVDAVDVDLDKLAYSLRVSPSNGFVSAENGELSWPAAGVDEQSISTHNLACLMPVSTSAKLSAVKKWHWDAKTNTIFSQVESLPIVLQVNDDNGDGWINVRDTPDIAFVAYSEARDNPGVLRVISGRDGAELLTVDDAGRRLAWAASPAAGDLTGDGVAEVVVLLMNGGVAAYHVDGSLLWELPPSSQLPFYELVSASPSIADLDGDGAPEIVVGKVVLDSHGSIKWTGAGSYSGRNIGLNQGDYHSVVADIDPSPGSEVIAGASVYSAEGGLIWQNTAVGDGYTALADLDGDNETDIVVVSAGKLYALNRHGAIMWGPVSHPGNDRGGHPVVADVDGDGRVEIGVGGRSKYAMFNHDGSLAWSIDVSDKSAGAVNGSAVFDFDGDGVAEVVVIDNFNILIVDGATGAIRLRLPGSTGTGHEYPVIVDVDNNGHADLIVSANSDFTRKLDSNNAFSGIRVYSGASNDWAPTRAIWNQHAYSIDNINDDGTVPRVPVKSWLTHNTFRLNTFPDRHPLGLADLALFDLRLDESDGTAVKVRVVNRGLAPTSAPTTVRVYNGDPDAGGALLGTLDVPVLASGEERTLTLSGLQADAISRDLYAGIDEANTLVECADDNNGTAAVLFEVRATDPEALFDSQRFTVTVENVNEAPTITTTSLPAGTGNVDYRAVIDATDPDLGDGLRYELIGAVPTGLRIDAVSGELSWVPLESQVGIYPITVRVTDLGGLSDERNYSLAIAATPQNRAPEIVSTPPASVEEASTYRYDVDALDPDADVLGYSSPTGPATRNIDAQSGLLQWTASESLVSGLRGSQGMCRTPAAAFGTGMAEKWAWTSSSSEPDYDQAASVPLVASLRDHNGDGRIDQLDPPSVVFVAFSRQGPAGWGIFPGRIRVVDGRSGADQWATNSSASVDGAGTPAIADIDGDGVPEIVAPAGDGGVIAFNNTGTVKWRTEPLHSASFWGRVVTISDLDGDGLVEIIVGNTVLDAHGTVLWRLSQFTGYNQSQASGLVSVADIDGDDTQEVIAGASAYSAQGVVKWKNDAVGDGYSAIADFDHDGSPEIVVVRSGVSLVGSDGKRIWGPVAIPGGGAGGPPTIGDMDGDGTPEIGVAGASRYLALKSDGAILWTAVTQDLSSHATGSTIFDLEADGRAEVLYRDERYFRIYDGGTGRILQEVPVSSATAFEYPVVADIDLDGAADILVPSDDLLQRAGRVPGPGTYGIRAYEGASGRWAPTRSIWNQHAYHIDNINDDGTVPRVPVKSWLTHNTFRLNTFPDRHPLGLSDLALFDLRLDESDGTSVKVRVVNRGLAPAGGATSVRIFNGDPDAGGALIGTLDVPVLAVGEELTLSLDGLSANAISTDLYARIDESNTVVECLDDNNHTAAAYFEVRAADAGGLYDSQRFTVTVNNVNESPSIETTQLPTAAVAADYRYSIRASDPDLGDGLRFELLNPPAGLQIEAVSGELRWNPLASQVGNHTVVVRVIDLAGLSAEHSFTLSVATNHPPEITSQPLTDADAGSEYRYATQARDIDGDALSFSLTLAPQGMVIDAASGLVSWTPAAGSTGSYEVEIRVDDARGGFTLQRYAITLGVPENNAPQITSVPVVTAVSGLPYSYSVDATDADGDTLTIVLKQAPAGMSLNEFTGELRWIPGSGQLGANAVSVEVSDGRGGIATQSFTVMVTAPADNNAPTITSTPTHHGKADHAYTYAAVGVDADGDAIGWSLTTAPAGMTVDSASGQVQWMPAAPGDYAVTLRAADAGGYSDQSWTITVVAADVALSGALTVTPQPLEPGATMTATLLVEGAAGPVTVTATLDGQAIAIADAGTTTLVAPDAPGTHTLVVVISDGIDSVTVTQPFTVRDPADGSAPEVKLVLPAEHPDYDAVEVTAPTPVTGFVTGGDVTQWLLGVRASGESATRLLAQGVGEFSEREIARFDPTQLHNGLYTLILQAQDGSGNVASDSRMVRVTDAMKLGHYSISFEDVSIPVAGIPVTVTRTYDTRRAHESLDFGYGWTVDYRNVVLQESRRPGYAWTVLNQGGTFGQTCIRPMGDPIVMVRLPGGETASFKAKALPECRSVFDGDAHVQLVFEAVDGNDYTLEQTDYGILRWANVQGSPVPVLFDESSGSTEPADPQHYKLTTPEGLVYELEQGFGIRQVTEPTTGATLTYSSAGVKHSSGVGIDFIRDGQGRITMMKLPDGKVIEYGYSAPGDLDIVLDAGKEITSFGYAPQWPHYLQDIVDPRGVRVARNEYDDDGRLVAIIDADGHRTEYTHAIADRTERIKDRNGHVTTYVYDDRGRVLFETNALGETIARTYDGEGNTLSQTDALGRTTTWTYDARGNRLSETNAAGETTTSSYNNKNQLLSQTDSSGQVVIRNDYDSRTGTLLTGTTDALGHVTGFGYLGGTGLFGTGQLGGITDALGASTAFAYSFEGYKASETDALGNVTAFAYDATGRVTRESRTRTVNGQQQTLTTTYRYDGKGRLLETTHPDGSTTTAEYAGLDQPVKACDALNRCTVTEYDARGQVLKLTAPDGTTQSKQYDGNGNVIAETDGNGQTTRFVYDAANRLVETIFADGTPATDADNPRSRSVYDAAGQLVESIDENGQRTRYVYDSAGRRTQVLLPAVAGETAGITTEYDASGRRRASVDATGAVTTYGYDAAGRLLETVFADGSAVRTGYDAVGRKVMDSDEMGRITRYGYDALGRLVTVVLPNPVTGANPPLVAGDSPDSGTLVTRYQYDEAGNKIAQIDAEGRITRWEYDVLGREIARTLPDGQRETKAYDEAGQLASTTDFLGKTTGYDYDANGRLLRIDYPQDADVSFVYDGNGQRTRVIDGRGVSTRAYDARGRLVAVNDATGGQLEYEYDPAGNLLARISPSQSLVYGFDARNRITAVTRSVDGEAPSTTAYGYDAAGNRTAMTGGEGVQSTYRYDRRHRLSSLVKRTAAGLLLAGMNYSVDASGLRTAVEESDVAGITRTVDYRYDAAKRLTSEVIGHRDAGQDRVSQWTYDRVGNRLTQSVAVGAASTDSTSYHYDANDRLLSETGSAGTTMYAYDDNGNTLSKSGAAAVSYRYDDANRLIEARTNDATITYAYDADSLRTTQTVTPNNGSQTTTHYLQDPAYAYAQVVEEWTQEGGNPKRLSATYAFADELVSQTRYDATGNPSTSFVQADGFGSTRWVTDAGGTITDSVDYDAFGNTIHRTGSTGVEHLYRGERWDANIAAYDLRARLYTPESGRFLTQDSFNGFGMDPQSLHKYTFNHNDPVNRVDPSGHFSLVELSQAITIRAISLAIAYPRTAALVTFAVNAVVPLEMQMAMPQTSALVGIGGRAALASAHELSGVRDTLVKYGRGFWKTGLEFEDWIAATLRINKSNLAVLNGVEKSSNVKGSAVIDFIYRGSILEAKISSSAMTKNQAQQLALYAKNANLGLTYLFARKPSVADVERLERWVGAVAPGMEVKINWIFPF